MAVERPNPEFNAPGKARAVQAMFADIAPNYDRLNHILSLNIDKVWRRFTITRLRDILQRPGALVLDLCCGTADLTLEIEPYAKVVGCDFCHPMLVIGNRKLTSRDGQGRRAFLAEGNALQLPFADQSFDIVTIAFGLRNLERVDLGLAEIYRVLRPGGRAAILEFSRPILPGFRQAFSFYFNRILPRIGALISGSATAYTYLPQSVGSFPDQKSLAKMMEQTGFSEVRYHNLSLGIAALHLGERS